MAGPQRARLDTALTGAFEHVVDDHAREWNTCVRTLSTIAAALRRASPEMKEQIGGETGPAIDRAFAKSAQGMEAKARELVKGSGALQSASEVIRAARQERAELNADTRQEPGEYRPPVGQPTEKDLQEEAQNKQAHAAYDAWYADQERRAQIQADRMDRVFEHSTAVMKDIHGIPDPEQPPGGPGGGSDGPGGGSAPGPASAPGGPAGGSGPRSPQPPTPYDPPGPNGGKPGPGYVPGPGGDYVPPIGSGPQGGTVLPIDYTPGTSGGVGSVGSAGPAGSGGLGVSTGAGVAGAAAGGLGGLLASGLAGRGGVTPVVASPGTAASGVRGIGATARTGISGALGKPGVSAVSPSGGPATASRSAASRAAGSRGTGGAAGRGSRSSAAGPGGTAAGRAGNRKDDEKRRKHDLFDASEDWVDDEDAAPSVLD